MEKNKKDKIVLLIVIIGLIIVGIFIYFMFFNEKNYEEWNDISESKYSINIYEYDNMLYFDSVIGEEEKNKGYIKYTYYCKSENCNGYHIIDEAPFAIIKDGRYYVIYNYNDNKFRYLNIKNELKNADILYYNNNIYGLVTADSDNKYKLYSLNTNTFVTENKYIDYENNSAAFIDNKFIGIYNPVQEDASYDIVDLTNGSVTSTINGAYTSTIKMVSKGNNNVFYLIPRVVGDYDGIAYDLYNSSFNLIKTTNYGFLEILNDNAVIKTSKNEFATIDSNGSVVKKSNNYKEIIMLCKDYVFVVDNDNYIKIVDYNDKFISRITEYVDSYYFHTELSGWNTKDGKDVLYLVIEDTDLMDDEIGKSIEYYYNPSTKIVDKNVLDGVNGYEKPIIYLYPTTDNTEVTIEFEKPYLLTTTYPKYINRWNVIANKNGDLHDLNNKYYYGLYFEEKNTNDINFKEGFYVTKENAIEFLEEKLSIIGLNDKEKNEFIMYWLPILEKNEKNLVYFELTSSRENYNKLKVTPKPDSILRFSIHIKKVDKKVNINEQVLEKFNRVGFTLVEWGGVNHK